MSLFEPEWASPPGDTIRKILNEREIRASDIFQNSEISREQLSMLLSGEIPISSAVAFALAKELGGSPEFWTERDSQYWSDRKRLEKKHREDYEWLDSLPVKHMIANRWIVPQDTRRESKIKACLDFFDVDSSRSWYNQYCHYLSEVAFRTSNSFDSIPESVIAWLRQGAKKSEESKCSDWDKDGLVESIDEIKSYSRESNPNIFLPILRTKLARFGVILVVAKAPPSCRASGATMVLNDNRRLLMLSFRHRTDDHFWFTLLHEIGHLVLHSEDRLILEGESLNMDSKLEEEANRFAEEALIPATTVAEFHEFGAKDWRRVIRFAKNIGVSPGIVVGQLQHLGRLKYNQLNKLKVRYDWKNISH